MKIFIGSDHHGFHLKDSLINQLKNSGYQIDDEGDEKLLATDDYPIFASKVVSAVLSSSDDDPRGILLCGSGQGMVMTANRYKGIRACMAWDIESARASRNDDDSNVLCLASDRLDIKDALTIAKIWLDTPFGAAPRYIRRIKEMDNLG